MLPSPCMRHGKPRVRLGSKPSHALWKQHAASFKLFSLKAPFEQPECSIGVHERKHSTKPSCIASPGTSEERERVSTINAHIFSSLFHACISALLVCSTVSSLVLPPWAGAELSSEPQVGDCTDCIGEVNGSLNACQLDSSSCVSSSNDDAGHFIAPWMFDSDRNTAIEQLVRVATGGDYDPGLLQEPYGIRRTDAAKWILGTTANFVLGKPLPEKPVRQRSNVQLERFDGQLVDRHTASDGSEYVHFVFGEQTETEEASTEGQNILDAEFTFLPDDAVVNLRSSSRSAPSVIQTKFSLSFEYGVQLDQNLARRRMDKLRKALHWEEVPVISDFDPKFNNEPLWFEKIYEPFKITESSE